MDKQTEIMTGIIGGTSPTIYSIDMDKINTLDDVKKVLGALDIKIRVINKCGNEQYEALKDYLK